MRFGVFRTTTYFVGVTSWLFVAEHTLAKPASLSDDLDKLNVRHRTEHYAIAGTITDPRLAEYGRCLEYIYKEYAKGFSELLAAAPSVNAGVLPRPPDKTPNRRQSSKGNVGSTPRQNPNTERRAPEEGVPAIIAQVSSPGDADTRFPVIVFAKEEEYLEFSKKYFAGDLEHSRGAFVPTLKLLIVRDDPNSNETYETLFHEAFHQFAFEYIRMLPTWLNEGLATYYGIARPTESGLAFDRPALAYFQIVRKAQAAKLLVPLRDLMLMSRAEFYEQSEVGKLSITYQALCYGQAYTLVAYILNNQAGATHLRLFLKDLADAKSANEVQKTTDRYFDKKLLDAMATEWLIFCQKH